MWDCSGFSYLWHLGTVMLPVVAVPGGVRFVHEDLYQHHILGGAIILFSAALGHERMRMSKRTKGST